MSASEECAAPATPLKRAAVFVLLLCFVVSAFPVAFVPVRTDLDPSWQFALNYLAGTHFKYGKDIVWTYGPLGFIDYPMNVGRCLDIAVPFQLLIWAAFSALFIYYALKSRLPLFQLFMFVVLFSSAMLFNPFSVFVCTLIFFLLSLSLTEKRWAGFYIVALFLTVLVSFIKVSYPMFLVPAFGCFVLCSVVTDKKKAFQAAIIAAVGLPLLFVAFYMVHNPSLRDMFSYLKGIREIIGGYSTAMSREGRGIELAWALLAFLIYAFMMSILHREAGTSFWLSAIFLLPLFYAFKYGFVRQDNHVMFFFSSVLIFIGFIVLFTDIKNFKVKSVMLAACGAMLLLWYFSVSAFYDNKTILRDMSGYDKYKTAVNIATNYDNIKESLNRDSEQALKPDKLSEDLLRKIGSSSTGIFPWEVSYAAANKINYYPFPVLQAYSVYTQNLDLLTSSCLERVPEFVLMEWKAIDGRHPLIDVPATWFSMYKWFDADGKYGKTLLLKRREKPRFNNMELIKRFECPVSSMVAVPISDHPVVAKISLELSAMGKLSKIFFRIPPVGMGLITDSGNFLFRVVPDTLGGPLIINCLPFSNDGVLALLNNHWSESRIYGLAILGGGASYYKDKMLVEFYDIPDVKIDFKKPPGRLTHVSGRQALQGEAPE